MSSIDVDDTMPGRWNHLRKILERPGPFCHSDFEPSPDNLQLISNQCNILLIGAGGLGCELLKDLALMGFHKISVIDMDTIDLSNLNRQFLFRRKDIGKPKAEVAAKYINERIPGVKVTPYFSNIQDFDESFYQQFHIIVCGLDSIVARRWINGMIFSMLSFNDGELDTSTVIPIIDGGTEGFKGNVRVIYPGLSACIECTLDLYPPQVNYPLCTIANTPRLPEHCIEYVKVVQWSKENPFDCVLDGDDVNHINWVYEKSQDRANQFGITGLTYRLVQGVVKNIIPAVASTNAVIAAACALEVFKVATNCFTPLNNYLVFNDTDGIYTYSYESEKKPDCIVCSNIPQNMEVESEQTTLQTLINLLCSQQYQMKNPGITASIGASSKTLYLPNVKSIEEKTRGNLKKTLAELGIKHDTLIYVADITNPKTLSLFVKFKSHTEMSIE